MDRKSTAWTESDQLFSLDSLGVDSALPLMGCHYDDSGIGTSGNSSDVAGEGAVKQRWAELPRYVRGWIGCFALAKQVEEFLWSWFGLATSIHRIERGSKIGPLDLAVSVE